MKPLGEGDTGFRVLRVSKNKREGRNSREKKPQPSTLLPPRAGGCSWYRRGPYPSAVAWGCAVPPCLAGAGGEGWGGAGAVPWEPGASELGVQGVLHLRRQLGVEGGEAHPEI